MNDWVTRGKSGLSVLSVAVFLSAYSLHAASNVAPPNILLHNKVTGESKVWFMSGTGATGENALPATSDDPAWKMIGSGDFNQDGHPDILWQNERTGQNAVWFMNGTIKMYLGALIQPAGDLNWKLVGVADFNGDGRPDLLWQNLVSGQNAVWLMNGTTPSSYNLIVSSGDPNWRIVATGDLNGDGKPDIILRNQTTGQNAVWYMNGLTMVGSDLLRGANGLEANEVDRDWQIVGTGDYNGDGKPDLLWRHATLAANVVWFLNGNIVTGSTYLDKQEFNPDWRIASQDTADSTWRLQTADFTYLRAAVNLAGPQVVLTFKLPRNSGFGGTVQRRLTTETAWTTLATGLTVDTFTDSTVVLGRAYEYRAFREAFGGSQYSGPEHLLVALNTPPIEDRGKVVLLVDQTLSSQLAPNIDQLSRDLVGDGWRVARFDVPRHVDDYSSATSFGINASNSTNVIKPLLRAAYTNDPGTKAVLILGHVSIPYSGSFNPDGHTCGPAPYGPDHRGAWPADMFYGDLDGTWTDTSVNLINCNFLEPNNVPGDGKFDQDGIAPPFVLRLAIGRVDFARLPVFTATPPAGISPKSEAALIQQYLTKDHLYRLKLLSWQQGNPIAQTLVYGHFHDGRDNQIFENAQQAAGAVSADPSQLVVGDFALQRSKPTGWGMLAGPGSGDRINDSNPVLQHSSADLTNPANEPKTVFATLLASWMGDWNLDSNNYLRSLLATPNFGLASMWTRFALWRTDAMGIGEHLGGCLVRMVNDPKNAFYDRSRDLAILGDPTLRLHILAPVTALTANTSVPSQVQLSWSGSESGAQYYVYRSSSLAGPFTRLSPSPVAGTTFSDSSPVAQKKVYMVRALKPMTTGNGSYTNISQGTVVTAN